MYTLTNKGKREVGLPAPVYGAIVLLAGGFVQISNDHYEELIKTLQTQDAIRNGIIVVKHCEDKPKVEEWVDSGVKLVSQKGGWWKVYVNGHLVTDKAVRKEEAEKIAVQYQ